MQLLEAGTWSQTIDYTYDPLYRLTAADYSGGDYFHYNYDAVGNRLSEEKVVNGLPLVETEYTYDIANRLATVGAVEYTWDYNGNLLNDGVTTYTYDPANRLSSLTDGVDAYTYSYTGLGDRLQQTVNPQQINYTLDLNAGLTQVLDDGANEYTYGLERLYQQGSGTPQYFLGDALGSVRQVTDQGSAVLMSKAYDPYGNLLAQSGIPSSPFAYAGEQLDQSSMLYLRARYYQSPDGRFLSKDTWDSEIYHPMTINKWIYTEGNPVNYTDPSGHRRPCNPGWDDHAIKSRVDEAQKHVYRTSDPLDTYVAAGIAIQCAGTDTGGVGIAQVSKQQAQTEWGEPVTDILGSHGYGLRLRCPNGQLEKALDPNNAREAVVLMKRRIQIVLDECKQCTATDRYIAAALAQNGPGFTPINMRRDVAKARPKGQEGDISRDWDSWFSHGQRINNQVQLHRFDVIMRELRNRRWIIPWIDTDVVDRLKDI
jgi:RHS repeat-associated protein